MNIEQSNPTYPLYVKALEEPVGTPIVACNAAGLPIAFGIRMSPNPEMQKVELGNFALRLIPEPDKAAKVTTALSAAVDYAADFYPGWSQQATEAGDCLALFSTGISLIDHARKGDSTQIGIASLMFGASALKLLSDSGVLGAHPMLHPVALATKMIGGVFAAVATPAKPIALYSPGSATP